MKIFCQSVDKNAVVPVEDLYSIGLTKKEGDNKKTIPTQIIMAQSDLKSAPSAAAQALEKR